MTRSRPNWLKQVAGATLRSQGHRIVRARGRGQTRAWAKFDALMGKEVRGLRFPFPFRTTIGTLWGCCSCPSAGDVSYLARASTGTSLSIRSPSRSFSTSRS